MRFAVVVVSLLLTSGCISELEHEPNLELIKELGADQAGTELTSLLTGAVSPVHSRVQVSSTSVSFWSRVGVGRSMIIKVPQRFVIPYTTLSRARVFANGKVYLLGAEDESLWRVRLRTVEASKRLVDLLFSLKAWPGPWPPSFAPVTPSPDPAPPN